MTLVLRQCPKDKEGNPCSEWNPSFRYPWYGPIAAPDWNPRPSCGKGLHGVDMGCQDYLNADTSPDRYLWLVIEVDDDDFINLTNKCKFKQGEVLFCGSHYDAGAFLAAAGCFNDPQIGPCDALFTIKELKGLKWLNGWIRENDGEFYRMRRLLFLRQNYREFL